MEWLDAGEVGKIRAGEQQGVIERGGDLAHAAADAVFVTGAVHQNVCFLVALFGGAFARGAVEGEGFAGGNLRAGNGGRGQLQIGDAVGIAGGEGGGEAGDERNAALEFGFADGGRNFGDGQVDPAVTAGFKLFHNGRDRGGNIHAAPVLAGRYHKGVHRAFLVAQGWLHGGAVYLRGNVLYKGGDLDSAAVTFVE